MFVETYDAYYLLKRIVHGDRAPFEECQCTALTTIDPKEVVIRAIRAAASGFDSFPGDEDPSSIGARTNKQSVAAIQLVDGTNVTVSGICLSLGKSLPSSGYLNQKGFVPRINGCACVLQTPHRVSLTIFCDRHLSSP